MSNTVSPALDDMIIAAVNSQIETKVFEALTSDNAIRTYVSAALEEKVKDGDSYSGKYDKFISVTVKNVVKEITKKVVVESIKEHEDLIKAEVADALRNSIGVITESLVDGFVASAAGRYPSIEVNFK